MNKFSFYQGKMRQQIVNHPWAFLAKELDERNISQVKFSQLIDITEAEVSNIIHGKKNITPRIAYRIEAALWTPASIWLKRQNDFDVYKMHQDKNETKKFLQIREKVLEFAY